MGTLALVSKMITSGLFRDPERRSYAAMPEMDALTEEGALQEAALVDVRFDVVESTLGLLFDLRLALQLRMGNAGILIGREASACMAWWPAPLARDRGLDPTTRLGHLSLRLGFAPDAELLLETASAEFYLRRRYTPPQRYSS